MSKVIAVDLGGTNLRVALLKTIKLNKVLKQKVYKLNIINKNSMLPGDRNWSSDELRKVFKAKDIITNIQVPGMAFRSNAGLPTHFISSLFNLRRKI